MSAPVNSSSDNTDSNGSNGGENEEFIAATKRCVTLCNHYVVGTLNGHKYKTALLHGGQCFCSKSKHLFNGAAAPSCQNNLANCDWTHDVCQVFTYTVINLGNGIQTIELNKTTSKTDASSEQQDMIATTHKSFTFPDLAIKGT